MAAKLPRARKVRTERGHTCAIPHDYNDRQRKELETCVSMAYFCHLIVFCRATGERSFLAARSSVARGALPIVVIRRAIGVRVVIAPVRV